MKLGLIKMFVGIIPNIKKAIYSDGKFNKKRTTQLLIGLIIILISLKFLGVADTIIALDLLDDLSDSIGHD